MMRDALSKTLPVVALSTLALAGSPARADTFPSKPIRLIVSTSPGGLTDLVARTVGKLMSEGLGQSVVIDNRPGAGTLIGMSACASVDHDNGSRGAYGAVEVGRTR